MKDSDYATWVFLARSVRLEAGLFNWKSNPWRHKAITLSIAFSFKLFLKCLERPWFNIRMVKMISRNVVFRSQKVIQIHFFFSCSRQLLSVKKSSQKKTFPLLFVVSWSDNFQYSSFRFSVFLFRFVFCIFLRTGYSSASLLSILYLLKYEFGNYEKIWYLWSWQVWQIWRG